MKTPKSAYRLLVASLSLAVLICFCAIAIGWYYVFQMSSQVSQMQTEALNMRKESSQLSALSISYQKVLPQKNVVFGAIPTTKSESTFMADLEATAKANGLTITSSTVGNSKTKTAKAGEFSQTVNKSEYYELPIGYEVEGLYGNFTKFISDLTNLRRLNSVDDISVTSVITEPPVAGNVKARFSVTIFAKK